QNYYQTFQKLSLVMSPSPAFHLLSGILKKHFFFCLGFDAIYLPTKNGLSEIVSCKDLMRCSPL
ncbi:MAG: hypothetical protein WBG24_20840, partial [Syntrophobacteria bacterium]